MSKSVSSDIVESTSRLLARTNQQTADAYRWYCIKAELPIPQLQIFSDHCLSIAESGWKSFESVDAYLTVANQIDDIDEMLRIGSIGQRLTGYSFEPSATYFQMVSRVIESGHPEELAAIEVTGLAVQAQYNQASGLLSDYFRGAAEALTRLSAKDLQSWLKLVTEAVPSPRAELNLLINHTTLRLGVSWSFVLALQTASRRAANVYLQKFAALDRSHRDLIEPVNKLLLKFANEDIAPFLDGLIIHAPPTGVSLVPILSMVEDVPGIDVLDALVRHLDDLPQHRPDIVRSWLTVGLLETQGNAVATVAWVSLESARSVDTLRALEGQVQFQDHKRTFDLLAEAVSGRKMLVMADEDQPDQANSYRGGVSQRSEAESPLVTLGSDGREIRLPASVNLFDEEADNFGFYKISLFHQLGYAEFGFFDAIGDVVQAITRKDQPQLAERIFLLAEDARIDWRLTSRYPGIAGQMAIQKARARTLRTRRPMTRQGQLLEVMALTGLDANWQEIVDSQFQADAALVSEAVMTLKPDDAKVLTTLEVCHTCYDIIFRESDRETLSAEELRTLEDLLVEEMPEPIVFRGELDVASVESTLRIEALVEDLLDELQSEPDQPSLSMGSADPDQIDLEDLKKGDVGEGVGIMLTELANELGDELPEQASSGREEALDFVAGVAAGIRDVSKHIYDEWDHQIGDYRARWCTLLEHHSLDRDEDYVRRTMVEHEELSRRIRQHLNKVRPEMLRKVRGVPEGEDLDLERSVEYVVDRRAGFTPDENIYVQRQRKDRDVSTLFLLDMSASTDDIIPDAEAAPVIDPDIDDDEYLAEYFRARKDYEDNARRIIDLEKESVILMAEALEKLGDAYSVCGFSGYGRDQIDYYLCKDFDDPLDARTRGQIGGIKPCRSTRMGAPIRHAVKRLQETGSRIKALIIISDGYPQDHDYGTDRNSREYGLIDTMKALSEAKQQGVLTYCLTVDPSGHDYLREMCPDSQYMIIQDIEQLPEELSRVYRSLTG